MIMNFIYCIFEQETEYFLCLDHHHHHRHHLVLQVIIYERKRKFLIVVIQNLGKSIEIFVVFFNIYFLWQFVNT